MPRMYLEVAVKRQGFRPNFFGKKSEAFLELHSVLGFDKSEGNLLGVKMILF